MQQLHGAVEHRKILSCFLRADGQKKMAADVQSVERSRHPHSGWREIVSGQQRDAHFRRVDGKQSLYFPLGECGDGDDHVCAVRGLEIATTIDGTFENFPPPMVELQHRREIEHRYHARGAVGVWAEPIPRIPHDIEIGRRQRGHGSDCRACGDFSRQQRELLLERTNVALAADKQRELDFGTQPG